MQNIDFQILQVFLFFFKGSKYVKLNKTLE